MLRRAGIPGPRIGTRGTRLGGLEVGAGEGVEGGGDHELEVALGEDDVGVLPVEDFALLGEAEFAGEAVDGLGEDGAVGGTAAAAYGAAAAVEEAEVTRQSRATWWRARWAFQISQVDW